jgi:hypothetical protein
MANKSTTNQIKRASLFALAFAMFGTLSLGALATPAFAEGEEATTTGNELGGTSISISPVSNIISIEGGNTYDYSFKVTNGGDGEMKFEVYAAPYSYTVSEDDGEYKLGFSQENNYTQITRWITFANNEDKYVEKPVFTAGPNETVEVKYRITTPESIPAGGQYAVLFAHTLSSSEVSGSGIKTEASPGLVIYARAAGETLKTSEIRDLAINKTITNRKKETFTHINASAKIKNTGNVDITAVGTMTVQGIFGRSYYETPAGTAAISVIPETELTLTDEWEQTPYFGLFNVTWKVVTAGATETITAVILIMPAPIIVLFLILLTFITIGVIIRVKKRSARRARYDI